MVIALEGGHESTMYGREKREGRFNAMSFPDVAAVRSFVSRSVNQSGNCHSRRVKRSRRDDRRREKEKVERKRQDEIRRSEGKDDATERIFLAPAPYSSRAQVRPRNVVGFRK